MGALINDGVALASAPSTAGTPGVPGNSITLDYEADAGSVREIRHTLAAFARRHGAADRVVEDVRIAVSEAATNVVVHAYDRRNPGHLRVFAVVADDQMLVIIEDDGFGLGAPAETPGLGLGIGLIQRTTEQAVFFTREGGGATVQLRFKFTS